MNNITNSLIIPFINCAPGPEMLAQVSARLDEYNKQSISHSLWIDVPKKPIARFAIGHGRDVIFLKYYVNEKNIYSCVEFFIGFGNELSYYNFEFSCSGNMLGEYGDKKDNRRFLNQKQLERVRAAAKIEFNKKGRLFEWELTIAIPIVVFEFHDIEDFTGMTCRLNFFKCADDLIDPHYLAWNAINDAEPNLHRPEYFGVGMFERSGALVEL